MDVWNKLQLFPSINQIPTVSFSRISSISLKETKIRFTRHQNGIGRSWARFEVPNKVRIDSDRCWSARWAISRVVFRCDTRRFLMDNLRDAIRSLFLFLQLQGQITLGFQNFERSLNLGCLSFNLLLLRWSISWHRLVQRLLLANVEGLPFNWRFLLLVLVLIFWQILFI